MRTKIAILAALLFIGIASVNAQKYDVEFVNVRTYQTSYDCYTYGEIYSPATQLVNIRVDFLYPQAQSNIPKFMWAWLLNDKVLDTGLSIQSREKVYLVWLNKGLNPISIQQRVDTSTPIKIDFFTETKIKISNPETSQVGPNDEIYVYWNPDRPQN